MTTTAPLQLLRTFRRKLLDVFPRRADALFEMIDALLLTIDPRSPVEVRAPPPPPPPPPPALSPPPRGGWPPPPRFPPLFQVVLRGRGEGAARPGGGGELGGGAGASPRLVS